VRRALALFLLAATVSSPGGAALAASRPEAGVPFDVIIRHGAVIEGTGAGEVIEDVGVRGGLIVAVGDLGGAKALQVVEARGLVVAPGFINAHDHADAADPVTGGGPKLLLALAGGPWREGDAR
jgi:N-acyl-D-amino-acid deacylase